MSNRCFSCPGWIVVHRSTQLPITTSNIKRRVYLLESHDQLESSSSEYWEFPVHTLYYVTCETEEDSAAGVSLDADSSRGTSVNYNYLPGVSRDEVSQEELSVGGHGDPDTLITSSEWAHSVNYTTLSEMLNMDTSKLVERDGSVLTAVAHLTGGPRSTVLQAAAMTASILEENVGLASQPVEDENMPVLHLDITGMSPMDLGESVNDLLRPLRKYTPAPRSISPASVTSDKAESVATTPPLSPANTIPTAISLSPIPAPQSPTSTLQWPNSLSLALPIIPSTPLGRREDRVEFRTSTAKTPLQAVLEVINQQLDPVRERNDHGAAGQEREQDDRAAPLGDEDTTMKTV